MQTKAQLDNLRPFEKGTISSETAKRNGSLGGIRSAEAKREKKLFKEEILKRLNEEDWEEMCANLITRAKSNDSSLEVLRDTIGQKPITEVKAEVDAEVVIDAKMK